MSLTSYRAAPPRVIGASGPRLAPGLDPGVTPDLIRGRGATRSAARRCLAGISWIPGSSPGTLFDQPLTAFAGLTAVMSLTR
jgi:hypothetical protein